MSIKLAVPDNTFASNIYNDGSNEEFPKNYKHQLIKTTDDKCQRMLANREVDAALITPLAFAKLSDNKSLRVIPTYCVAAEDFTAATNIYFKGGVNGIESMGSPSPHSYLALLSKILLNELYGIETNVEKSKSNKDDIFDEHEVAILHYEDNPGSDSLDLSEEWLQQYEHPLPMYFWACWADNQRDEVKKATEEVAPGSVPTYKEVQVGEEILRKGRIHFLWHEKIEKAIDHTLEILYYNQHSREIHSIKLFDSSEGKSEE